MKLSDHIAFTKYVILPRRYGLYRALFLCLWLVTMRSEARNLQKPSHLLALSGKLLLAVKTEQETKGLEITLADLPQTSILAELEDDTAKKVFWINIYNAYFQLLASREKLSNPTIFTSKSIYIAGVPLSLDDIEHGILRKYRVKWAKGYLPKWFVGKPIKKWAVERVDYRIHFALNCGAASCPPIAYYTADKLEEQLNLAMKNFLLSETTIVEKEKKVVTNKILYWYQGDFSGRKGILDIISKVMEQDLRGYSLDYAAYDWSQKLQNFSQ
ncbi:uncharacterized protein DUF547 [Dyadobacter jejuensis]|uniref:Uncharacterized protein DUF547 n=1 Tax=Dyadobacter jejuensis TaxID=1082580 RepID=A0A316B791_9BACT|nr:DUF547 domain-containing protein [Dyadobacter jejuensis]PWJ58477.1 uncharacterized protein DUF547 [Dyadobacter jejuensis]